MDNFRQVRKVGAGTYGDVWLVRDKRDKRKYVMKRQLYVLPKDRQLAAKEIQMLSSLRHPNIVAYHEAFVSEQFIFIVMQYCDGGDLDQLLKAARQRGQRLNERFIIRCFLQARLQPEPHSTKRLSGRAGSADMSCRRISASEQDSAPRLEARKVRLPSITHQCVRPCMRGVGSGRRCPPLQRG
jgi:NIMA (never in mitosis gene a)-related kinase